VVISEKSENVAGHGSMARGKSLHCELNF